MNWPYSSQSVPKHKTFISFHHADEKYKIKLGKQWAAQFESFVSRSVNDGDIDSSLPTDRIRQIIRDDFIAGASVTLVLVGEGTWRRRHVDWEIGSSIRDTKNNPRTGLLGILLPSYRVQSFHGMAPAQKLRAENGGMYNPFTIPPRLYDNVSCGFAKIYSWPSDPDLLKQWIHEAFQKRNTVKPDNSYPSFSRNRSDSQTNWSY